MNQVSSKPRFPDIDATAERIFDSDPMTRVGSRDPVARAGDIADDALPDIRAALGTSAERPGTAAGKAAMLARQSELESSNDLTTAEATCLIKQYDGSIILAGDAWKTPGAMIERMVTAGKIPIDHPLRMAARENNIDARADTASGIFRTLDAHNAPRHLGLIDRTRYAAMRRSENPRAMTRLFEGFCDHLYKNGKSTDALAFGRAAFSSHANLVKARAITHTKRDRETQR